MKVGHYKVEVDKQTAVPMLGLDFWVFLEVGEQLEKDDVLEKVFIMDVENVFCFFQVLV